MFFPGRKKKVEEPPGRRPKFAVLAELGRDRSSTNTRHGATALTPRCVRRNSLLYKELSKFTGHLNCARTVQNT